MEAVIDSNFLRSPELRVFLSVSRCNRAVLTDYSAMEAYKNEDPVAMMAAQMEIVSDFPTQVLILKSTARISALRGRKAGLRRRLIDQGQTSEFSRLRRALRSAQAGDIAMQKAIAKYAEEARRHIDAMTGDMMAGLMGGIVDMVEVYRPAELKALRTGCALPDSMIKTFADHAMLLAAMLHKAHPHSPGPPKFHEMVNTYFFRAAVCMQVMVLRWAEAGRTKRKPEELRNDVIDLHFASIATFFDAFFTHDKAAQELYSETKAALISIVPEGLMP